MADAKRTLDLSNIFFFAFFHLGAFVAVWYGLAYGYSVYQWLLFAGLSAASGFGVTVGYHRLVTHGGFKCGRIARVALSIFGAMALEGAEKTWVANHRAHHFFSDTEGDLHSPLKYPGVKGFLWAHFGWFFVKYELPPAFRSYRDLERDPVVQWQSKYYFAIVVAGLFLSLAAGPEGGLLAGFLRVVVLWHITWSVNSICHLFGRRAKDSLGNLYSADESRNNLLIAVLGFGEGHHANHHACPRCAYHGWKRYDFDPGKWLIRSLELVGMAWDVKKPPAHIIFSSKQLGAKREVIRL